MSTGLGRINEAIVEVLKVLEINPGDPEVQRKLNTLLAKRALRAKLGGAFPVEVTAPSKIPN
jgi:hypothetical protein